MVSREWSNNFNGSCSKHIKVWSFRKIVLFNADKVSWRRKVLDFGFVSDCVATEANFIKSR